MSGKTTGQREGAGGVKGIKMLGKLLVLIIREGVGSLVVKKVLM